MKLASMIRNWKDFWFASFSYENFRLFQIVFCTVVFVTYLWRLFDFTLLYSNEGILPYEKLLSLPEVFSSYIPWHTLVSNPTLGFALHVLLLLLLLLVIFNFQNRYVLILIWILHTAFLRRNPIGLYGYDMVISFWFLFMAITLPKSKSSLGIELNSIAYRLVQLQLCIIYAYSGLEKAKGNTWWQGDALWFAYANTQQTSLDFSFLIHIPWLVALLSFASLLWETYFPVLVWIRSIRKYVLLFGVIFHLSIAFSMNLIEFSMVMIAPYLLFLDKKMAGDLYIKVMGLPLFKRFARI